MAYATKAPSMQRSRTQLAAAYAPHRPFVFEGGEGMCITVPHESNPQANLNAFTNRIIAEQIQENAAGLVTAFAITRAYPRGNER